MKHSAIAGWCSAAAMLASPVFAADKDLCAANIQQISDFVDSAPSLPEGTMDTVKAALTKAKASQAAGNDKDCVEVTSGIITKMQIRNPTRN